jgi:hypothetical protein
MLSSTSHIRVQVEQARMDILRWIGKRWVGVRQEGGFDELEGWAIKEISDSKVHLVACCNRLNSIMHRH